MSGPSPKPDGERRRRNQPTFDWVLLPEGSGFVAPPLPEFRVWQAETGRWWELLWGKGQAVMWELSGESLWTLACLMDDLFAGRVEPHRVSAEIRQHEDRHGLNPKAMMQLRWRFGDPVESGGKVQGLGDRKRAALKVLEGGG